MTNNPTVTGAEKVSIPIGDLRDLDEDIQGYNHEMRGDNWIS